MAKAKTPSPLPRNSSQKAPQPAALENKKQNVVSITNPSHTEETIRCRAYELFEERGRTHGAAMEDWLRAEAEIRSRPVSRTA